MAPTIIISPNPALKGWRGQCAQRSRSIRAPPPRSPRPRARSAVKKAPDHVHLRSLRAAAEAARVFVRPRAFRVHTRRVFVLGIPADAAVDAAVSAVAGVGGIRHPRRRTH